MGKLAIAMSIRQTGTAMRGLSNGLDMRRDPTPLDEIRRKINLTKDLRISNCIGTALFLVGERDYDEHYEPGPEVYYEHLGDLKELWRPLKGCLIAWQLRGNHSEVHHMGIVTSTDPLLVTHRPGVDMLVIENEPFLDIELYGASAYKVAFYLPQNLDWDPRTKRV
jgi:hypothetical protein